MIDLRALHGEGADIYPTLPADEYSLIVSDGAYGIGGFPGDPRSPKALADWYAPHMEAWDRLAAPSSSLYFWGTPEGCARMLPAVEAAGWTLNSQIRWYQGHSFIADMNYANVRGWVSSSEDCYFYVREAVDISAMAASEVTGDLDGLTHRSVLEASGADPRNTVRAFLRTEWLDRAGLTIGDAVKAWKSSASHYFTRSQWAIPTWEAYHALAMYATKAKPPIPWDRPYFVLDAVWGDPGPTILKGNDLLRASYEALRGEYEALRYPFTLPQSVTDVWDGTPVSRPGRHRCAKRDDHIERIVKASSRPGDRVLEPFGGGAPVLRACRKLGRSCDSIERDEQWHRRALACIDVETAARLPDPKALPGQGGLFG